MTDSSALAPSRPLLFPPLFFHLARSSPPLRAGLPPAASLLLARRPPSNPLYCAHSVARFPARLWGSCPAFADCNETPLLFRRSSRPACSTFTFQRSLIARDRSGTRSYLRLPADGPVFHPEQLVLSTEMLHFVFQAPLNESRKDKQESRRGVDGPHGQGLDSRRKSRRSSFTLKTGDREVDQGPSRE